MQSTTYSTAYAYSSIDNMTASQVPSGRVESYTYTPNGNLDTIVSEGKTYDYDYYDTGYIKSIIYPNGLQTSYEYDNINRVTKITTTKGNATINIFAYEYDANGNVTKETRNNKDTLYTYDSLDRLISVTYDDGTSVNYAYDALNNRTRETHSNGDVKEYLYNEKNQLKEVKLNGAVTDTYTYNETGAVTSHNSETYTYDVWDRLSGYSDGSDTHTYQYNGNGIRTQKDDKQYIVDIRNNVIAETDGAGEITEEILWGHQPLARKTNGSWYYYIYNAHGDVVGVVNDAGTLINTYEYDPWGNILSETETVDNLIKYAGEYVDDESGLIYLRNRYYDPSIGRFISEDPIKDGLNWYVYCGNNPVNYVDPWGLWEDEDEKLPVVEQVKIKILTALYYKYEKDNNIEARDAMRKAAVNIRNQYIENYKDDYDYSENHNTVKVSVQTLSAGMAYAYGGEATTVAQKSFPFFADILIQPKELYETLDKLSTLVSSTNNAEAMKVLRAGDVLVHVNQDYSYKIDSTAKYSEIAHSLSYTQSQLFFQAGGTFIAGEVKEVYYRYSIRTPQLTDTRYLRYANPIFLE